MRSPTHTHTYFPDSFRSRLLSPASSPLRASEPAASSQPATPQPSRSRLAAPAVPLAAAAEDSVDPPDMMEQGVEPVSEEALNVGPATIIVDDDGTSAFGTSAEDVLFAQASVEKALLATRIAELEALVKSRDEQHAQEEEMVRWGVVAELV
jgi:hypothetical protein